MLRQKNKQKFNQPGKGKKKGFFKKKKHVSNLKCYNYGKTRHFACDCKEPKKVNDLFAIVSTIYVFSSIFLIESYPLWTIDLGAMDHVVKDRSCLRGILMNLARNKMDVCRKQL